MLRGQRKRPLEWLVERAIYGISLSAILGVFLIFIFVARETLPIVLGQATSASTTTTIPVEALDTTSADVLYINECGQGQFFAARLSQWSSDVIGIGVSESEGLQTR